MGNLYSALDNEHPIPLATLVFIDPTNTKKFFSLSEQPLAPEAWNFFLSLLPSHQGPVKSQEYEPIVVFYVGQPCIVNVITTFAIHTLNSGMLFPPPQCHEHIQVGFICEPYYNGCKEDDDRVKLSHIGGVKKTKGV
ncbi:hypothetical protein DVH24_017181 [Malus domestica]|uniref:Uncharacterized protein n=1 Tax=Malus domestica TaxID=3750 RepID=A0A498IRP0_MALDO|nr:hypothetical protein DVH24_017181 [Malus domestica]